MISSMGDPSQSVHSQYDNVSLLYDNNNTVSASMGTNHTHSADFEFMISFSANAYLYYTPLLTVVGTIGNILSVMVFFRTRLRKLSSSYYLSALCISDTGFLLVNFLPWLGLFNINIYNQNGFCQLFTFLSGFCSALSVWFVVAFTIERFIAVMYPLKRQTMCTVKRAKSVLFGLIVVSAIHSMPLIALSASEYTADSPSTPVCQMSKGYEVSCIVSTDYSYRHTIDSFSQFIFIDITRLRLLSVN